jgi:hypothetical protein
MGLSFAEAFQLIYDLFIKYTFGSLVLAYLGSFIMVSMIAYKLHVSADGWVIVIGGYGAVAAALFLPTLALYAVMAVAFGWLIYFLMKRVIR